MLKIRKILACEDIADASPYIQLAASKVRAMCALGKYPVVHWFYADKYYIKSAYLAPDDGVVEVIDARRHPAGLVGTSNFEQCSVQYVRDEATDGGVNYVEFAKHCGKNIGTPTGVLEALKTVDDNFEARRLWKEYVYRYHPGCYSGRMREVVQILHGLKYKTGQTLPDNYTDEMCNEAAERRAAALTGDINAMEEYIVNGSGVPLNYSDTYNYVPFSFGADASHGIYTDAEGRLHVIEISRVNNAVYRCDADFMGNTSQLQTGHNYGEVFSDAERADPVVNPYGREYKHKVKIGDLDVQHEWGMALVTTYGWAFSHSGAKAGIVMRRMVGEKETPADGDEWFTWWQFARFELTISGGTDYESDTRGFTVSCAKMEQDIGFILPLQNQDTGYGYLQVPGMDILADQISRKYRQVLGTLSLNPTEAYGVPGGREIYRAPIHVWYAGEEAQVVRQVWCQKNPSQVSGTIGSGAVAGGFSSSSASTDWWFELPGEKLDRNAVSPITTSAYYDPGGRTVYQTMTAEYCVYDGDTACCMTITSIWYGYFWRRTASSGGSIERADALVIPCYESSAAYQFKHEIRNSPSVDFDMGSFGDGTHDTTWTEGCGDPPGPAGLEYGLPLTNSSTNGYRTSYCTVKLAIGSEARQVLYGIHRDPQNMGTTVNVTVYNADCPTGCPNYSDGITLNAGETSDAARAIVWASSFIDPYVDRYQAIWAGLEGDGTNRAYWCNIPWGETEYSTPFMVPHGGLIFYIGVLKDWAKNGYIP